VTRYLAWPRHRSVGDAEAFVAFSDSEWSTNGYGPYLIWTDDAAGLIGSTGLHADGAEVQTGYVLAKDAWGHGFATEALAEMVSLARVLGKRTLVAYCHPDNRASSRVLETCGFATHATHEQHVYPNLAPTPAPTLRYVRDIEPPR
jgi:RimJ/RimL family protein N-acetyltransferase